SGTFEGAVRFTPAELSGLDGKSLTEVIFYVLQEPRSATIKVYEGTANAAPVDLVQSFAVGADIQAGSWNRISLPNPRQIDATKDLWIAFRFDNQVNGQVLGCDRGPAAPYGDYLFDNSDGLWQKLSTRTANGININWNLRAVVE
ncbi:MAG: hypothetical protein NWR72_19015, partial [Bacteroidia bacterium]|nr:hypothetical protein [Bacteroidia bacterium]